MVNVVGVCGRLVYCVRTQYDIIMEKLTIAKYLEGDPLVERIIKKLAEEAPGGISDPDVIRFIAAKPLRYVEAEYNKLFNVLHNPDATEEDIVNALKAFGEIPMPAMGKFHLNESAINRFLEYAGKDFLINIWVQGNQFSRVKRAMILKHNNYEYKGKKVLMIEAAVMTKSEESKKFLKKLRRGWIPNRGGDKTLKEIAADETKRVDLLFGSSIKQKK